MIATSFWQVSVPLSPYLSRSFGQSLFSLWWKLNTHMSITHRASLSVLNHFRMKQTLPFIWTTNHPRWTYRPWNTTSDRRKASARLGGGKRDASILGFTSRWRRRNRKSLHCCKSRRWMSKPGILQYSITQIIARGVAVECCCCFYRMGWFTAWTAFNSNFVWLLQYSRTRGNITSAL